jgi:hypothetical protein
MKRTQARIPIGYHGARKSVLVVDGCEEALYELLERQLDLRFIHE